MASRVASQRAGQRPAPNSQGSVIVLTQRDFSRAHAKHPAHWALDRSPAGKRKSLRQNEQHHQNQAHTGKQRPQHAVRVQPRADFCATGLAAASLASQLERARSLEQEAAAEAEETRGVDSNEQQQQQQWNVIEGEQRGAAVAARSSEIDELDQAKQQQQAHSVGPVMGIFFKVWSLVKGEFCYKQPELAWLSLKLAAKAHFSLLSDNSFLFRARRLS